MCLYVGLGFLCKPFSLIVYVLFTEKFLLVVITVKRDNPAYVVTMEGKFPICRGGQRIYLLSASLGHLAQQGGIVLQADNHSGVFWSQLPLPDRERLLVERFRLSVATLEVV